jgi:hypothetical protein
MLQLLMPGVFNTSISSSMEPSAYPPSYSFVKGFISNSFLLVLNPILACQISILMPVKIINKSS